MTARHAQPAIEETHAQIIVDDLPVIMSYSAQLLLILGNLINNAIKYRKQEVSPMIIVSGKESSDYWEFSVEDNGIGFDPEYSKVVFELFKRLHGSQEYSGTGLGLAMCRKIAEQHGGKIWVDSLPGRGSKFYFTLSKVKFQLANQQEIVPVTQEV